MKSLNLMLDLETLGNESNSVIVSLAAVPFDTDSGEIAGLDSFYSRINADSQLKVGAKVNESTILWWMQQSDDARKKLYGDEYRYDIKTTLQAFTNYVRNLEHQTGLPVILWGNGARFDIGLLEDAFNMNGLPLFWHMRNEMCFRTLMKLHPEIRESIPFKGVKHNPIDDCKHQIACVVEVYNKMANKDIIV